LAVVHCLANDLGAEVSRIDEEGKSPLFMAASRGHLDVLHFLVKDLGVDINQASPDGHTALGFASARKHKSIAAWLIKNGANPQAVDPVLGTLADVSRKFGAPADQIAYLEAKMHCTNPGCSGAGLKKCTGCKQERYCGQQCQLAHWPAHKVDCKRRSESDPEGRSW
jgi:hypothetical protein